MHVTLKDFRPYYAVPAVYRSWRSPTNRGDSGAVLAVRGSCHGSSEELGRYYSMRKQDTIPDLGPILSTGLGTLASHEVVSPLAPLELRTPFPRLVVLIAEAPDLLIREGGCLDLCVASLREIPDIFSLIPEA